MTPARLPYRSERPMARGKELARRPLGLSHITRAAGLPDDLRDVLAGCTERPPSRDTLQMLRRLGLGWKLLCGHFDLSRARLDVIHADRGRRCPHCGGDLRRGGRR